MSVLLTRSRIDESPNAMQKPKLTAVTRTQGNNLALKQGRVAPQTVQLDFIEVDPLIDAFRRMVRAREFDVSELALTTYICAREHGKRITALPIFLVRAFHHSAILVNTKSGISSPKDLEGRRVGVNRGYTVTTGLWARNILEREFGVDLSKITWVLSGDEHVAEYQPPANVVAIEKGRKMADMLISGELVAAIGVDVDHPDIQPLIPSPKDAGFAALAARGHYPINHLIVVRDELLDAHPQLGPDLFNAFVESKRAYIERLSSGAIEQPTAVDKMHSRVMQITSNDPLPYGIEPNRAVLEEVINSTLSQGIIKQRVEVDTLFAASTRGLRG